MKKCTVLLGVFFILFTAILPSLAAELTFTGEYSNSTENEYLIETEGFNSIFKPGKLSLNVGYTYKDTEFNVGIKDFNLRDNYLGAPRYKLGQSIYVGFDSNNFNFSYLRGNYDKYGFNVEDDVIGFNMMYSYATMRGKFEEDAFNYLLPGFIAGIDFVITHENLFKAGFSIGKLSVLAYYFDSYYVFNKVDYNNPYNNKNYETTALLDSDFNGLALNANLNLNKYFNIGVTYSSLNYYESHKQYVGTFFDFYRDVETLGFNVSGKLPVISGEYFANVVMADYQNSDGSIHYKSEKPALNVGLRDIALRDDSMVKVGVDYALTNSETYLASNNNSSLGQVGLYRIQLGLESQHQTTYEYLHRVGASLDFYFTESLILGLNSGIIFSKNLSENEMNVFGNITTLDLGYNDVGKSFNLHVFNHYDLMNIWGGSLNNVGYGLKKGNNLYAMALGQIVVGNNVNVGIISENEYKYEEDLTTSLKTNNFAGATNLWAIASFPFEVKDSASVGVALGGSLGVIYGNVYNKLLEDNPTVLGRLSYDAYAGIDAKILGKFGVKFGVYAGTNNYLAHAIMVGSQTAIDFNWKDVNLVASTTISYDMSDKLAISLTGTYRNWEYMLKKEVNKEEHTNYDEYTCKYTVVKIADMITNTPGINTKFFVQAKLTFKPSDNMMLSLALGRSGLAPDSATNNDDAMVWDYLKIPVSYNSFEDLWKNVELNVSMKF